MDKKKLQVVVHESEAVREAIKTGVPPEEAATIYVEANRKAEGGEWVELYHQEPRYGLSEYHPHATSIVRFWGPSAYLEGKHQLSRSKAESLFEKGLVGKTHELVRGSRDYGAKPYEKISGKWQRKPQEGRIPEISPGGAYPPAGSRALHRHWEIEQMYRHKKRGDESLERRLLSIFAIGIVAVLAVLYGKSSGYVVFSPPSAQPLLSILLLIAFGIFFYVLRKKVF